MGTRPDSEYFPLIDGVRGLAAIAVMFRHMQLFGIHSIAQTYLGVDVFFALSGAVIASAYERKLLAGMQIRTFLGRRILRLWPMIVLGVGLGLVNAIWGEPEAAMGRWVLPLAALAIVVAGDNPLFPMIAFNRPSWTMPFEFAVNIAYAAIVRRLTGRVLVAICAACAVVLIWAAFVERGLDTGDSYRTLGFGCARTGFAFFVGVGLYRLHRADRLPIPTCLRSGWGVVIGAVLLTWCLLAPPLHGHRWIVAVSAALVVVPVITALGLTVRISGRGLWGCRALGALSYPLYLIHDPLGMFVAGNLIHLGRADLLPWAAAIFAPTAILLALAIHYWLDEPVRAWLAKSFSARKHSLVAAPAA